MCKRAEVIQPDGSEVECETVQELHEELCAIIYDDDGNEMEPDDSCLCNVDFFQTARESGFKFRHVDMEERPELLGGGVFCQ